MQVEAQKQRSIKECRGCESYRWFGDFVHKQRLHLARSSSWYQDPHQIAMCLHRWKPPRLVPQIFDIYPRRICAGRAIGRIDGNHRSKVARSLVKEQRIASTISSTPLFQWLGEKSRPEKLVVQTSCFSRSRKEPREIAQEDSFRRSSERSKRNRSLNFVWGLQSSQRGRPWARGDD